MADASITTLNDLEDYLDTLTQVVLELSRAALYPTDRQALLRQYIHLEDTVLKALFSFIETKQPSQSRKRLPDMISGFNQLTSEWQGSWAKSMWKEYEYIREDGNDGKRRLPKQMEEDVAALQDLALYLSKIERERRSVSKRNSSPASLPHTLAMVDLEAENYKTPKRCPIEDRPPKKEGKMDKHDCSYGCDSCRLL